MPNLSHDPPQFGDLVNYVSQDSFLPLLLLPGIVLVTPLSDIPGFATIMGIIVSLISIQLLMRRDEAW